MKFIARFLLVSLSALMITSLMVWADNDDDKRLKSQRNPCGGFVTEPNTIYACANPAGQLRSVECPAACRPNETLLTWNIAGPAGPRGLQGERGLPGPQGSAGANGSDGIAGPQGEQGLPGPQGLAGVNGSNGAIGPQGPQGEQGPTGPQGSQGEQGLPGPQGLAGANGSNGAIGPQGEQGLAGPQGPQGLPGSQGLAGANGSNGAIGPQGEQGLAGPQGPQGLPGPQGPAGSGESFALLSYDLPPLQTAGPAIGGSWITRGLNTEVYDPDGIVVLAGNEFTLTPGSYIIEADQVFFGQVGVQQDFRGRIRNKTNGTTQALGLNVRIHLPGGESAAINVPIPPTLVTLSTSTTFQLQYFAQGDMTASFGLGGAFMNTGEPERYAFVHIRKVK